jgi:hypothetical protein
MQLDEDFPAALSSEFHRWVAWGSIGGGDAFTGVGIRETISSRCSSRTH